MKRVREDEGDEGVRAVVECPYLDSVCRPRLDLDFEARCSVTLSPLNVYCCLVCGRFFQGRGPATVAYTHSLEASHHVFLALASGRVFCLPDGYEVLDRSLDDIRHVLKPRFSCEAVRALDRGPAVWSRGLDGREYLPGLVGLNNLKASDYAAVVVQALMRVRPLRDALLTGGGRAPEPQLLSRLGELARKLWNPRAFKGHVSPHQFLQAVATASGGRFTADRSADPVDFLAWLLNTLRRDFGDAQPNVVDACFGGFLRVVTLREGGGEGREEEQRTPFLMLGLELPPPPLFADALEKNILPQASLASLLAKFDGVRESPAPRGGRRRYSLLQTPRHLVLHVKRFTKNNFFVEKNPTLVTFPVRGLELRDTLPLPSGCPSTYDLVANVVHEGKPGEGAFRAQVLHRADSLWYEAQDLSVAEVLPQQVALSEALLLVYERRK